MCLPTGAGVRLQAKTTRLPLASRTKLLSGPLTPASASSALPSGLPVGCAEEGSCHL